MAAQTPRQVMLEDAQIENPETAVSPAAGPSSDDIQPVLMPLPGTSADLPYSTDAEDASQIPAGEARWAVSWIGLQNLTLKSAFGSRFAACSFVTASRILQRPTKAKLRHAQQLPAEHPHMISVQLLMAILTLLCAVQMNLSEPAQLLRRLFRLANAPGAAAGVRRVHRGMGQHNRQRQLLHAVWAGHVRGVPAQPGVRAVPDRHLRQQLGILPLSQLRARYVAAAGPFLHGPQPFLSPHYKSYL